MTEPKNEKTAAIEQYPVSNLVAAVVALLKDAVIGYHDTQLNQTFLVCRMCGEWEEHTETCPVPALEQWVSP